MVVEFRPNDPAVKKMFADLDRQRSQLESALPIRLRLVSEDQEAAIWLWEYDEGIRYNDFPDLAMIEGRGRATPESCCVAQDSERAV